MGMSNFPNGFSNGVTIRGLPLQVLHPGRVFWVNNSGVLPVGGIAGSNGNDGSYLKPFSTIDYAVGRCLANRGDVILVMPGHSENVTAAAGMVFDVAGVAVVGLGAGSKRPKINFTTATTADIDITAANVSFFNIEFVANFADVAAAIDVSGVAGLTFDSCHFTEAGTDLNYVDVIDVATGASQLTFNKCVFITNDAANDSHITGTNPAIDRLTITDCAFFANTAQTSVEPLIDTGSGAMTNTVIKNCVFRSNIDGAKFIYSTSASNSGVIANCYFSSIDTAGAITTACDFTGGHLFETYVSGEANAWGLLGGAVGGAVYDNA